MLSDDELRKVIGERLTGLIVNHWEDSQVDLAKQVRTHQTHISAMMAGRRFPSVQVLYRLAEALNSNADYILGRTDDEKPPSDLDDQIIVGVGNGNRRRVLQEIINHLARSSDEDLSIFLEVARRFSTPKRANRIREEVWAELWATVFAIGGTQLVSAFERTLGVEAPHYFKGDSPGPDEVTE